jgi:hypothetical protein
MMDASLSAMMLADAQAICAEAGQTVIINGVSYPAMVTDIMVTPQLETGGLMDRVGCTVKVCATPSAISAKAYMQPGKKLSYDSRIFRVVGFGSKPGSAWLQMTCVDEDQR